MVDVEVVDPNRAGEAVFRGIHEVLSTSQEVDLPDEEPVGYEDVVNQFRNPFPGLGAAHHWLGRRGGEVVAVATALFPEHDNEHVAIVLLTVHPKVRGQGIGTTVLRALVPELTARGRTVVEGIQVGRVGETWANALGFRTVNTTILQHLRFADADRSLWDVPVPEGYRVERWIGAAPNAIVASYAEAKNAIADSPRGEAELKERRWTVDLVREDEAVVAARGIEQRVVVAVHEATDEVVGMTEVWLQPLRKPWAYQRETTVIAAHRGHGLGRVVKAHMLRGLAGDRPDLVLSVTGTNADNVHMAAVNHALGFATVRSMVEVNGTVAGLLEALGGVDAEQRQAEHEHP
ncbi:GNAT family N-acetyltransferase [Umezawaea endophytica]|uniref:GNAT family N-acetyltransferase n=1 Tax=Umezawaea endophytica TaxID=1654476 RepID=A0A9X3AGZ0_9PSEU|nr:GNAT family N-acetyltransferase [Umezawaea endophytica]MCS7480256.1 GNAT family N-acetyltransferase [Umezawaea endophytica]